MIRIQFLIVNGQEAKRSVNGDFFFVNEDIAIRTLGVSVLPPLRDGPNNHALL